MRLFEFDANHRDAFAELVTLTLVCGGVDLPFVTERLLQHGLTRLDVSKPLLQVSSEPSGVLAAASPNIQHDCPEKTQDLGATAQGFKELDKLQFKLFRSNADTFATAAVVVAPHV